MQTPNLRWKSFMDAIVIRAMDHADKGRGLAGFPVDGGAASRVRPSDS